MKSIPSRFFTSHPLEIPCYFFFLYLFLSQILRCRSSLSNFVQFFLPLFARFSLSLTYLSAPFYLTFLRFHMFPIKIFVSPDEFAHFSPILKYSHSFSFSVLYRIPVLFFREAHKRRILCVNTHRLPEHLALRFRKISILFSDLIAFNRLLLSN